MRKRMFVKSMFWVNLETKIIPVYLGNAIYLGTEENIKRRTRNLEVILTKENGISFYNKRNAVSLDLTFS
ncbi:MAG TPA: hypothetical protein DDW76_05975 [Cyanobacteria bacterium UBA11369]|nr:hypothetical protein [Cyanobacteria bacterium UBA11371]HBE34856.1 hypothetical protein [Cyanobacteria bacterium UBA11368]HBE48353.1 hypothetical protein [Cyanobacteria bacterium UBA11369]